MAEKWEEGSWYFNTKSDPKMCCSHCGKADFNLSFIRRLNCFRFLFGRAVVITSGYRCPERQQEIIAEAVARGDKKPPPPESSHVSSYGVDVQCNSSGQRQQMITAAQNAGFHRIGIYNSHLHLDSDPRKVAGVFWVGKSQ